MKEFKKNIKFVWQYSKGEKKNILKYLSLNLFDIVASIFFPIISAQIIVNLTDNNIKQFLYIGCVLLIAHLIESTLSHFKSKLYEKTLRETYINIQTSLGAEILKLNNKTLEENGSGMFIQRLIGDTRNIEKSNVEDIIKIV